MSLFPDRSSPLTTSRELALVSPVLTEEQKRQLSSVTEGYLKEYHLIGFENTRAVLPVIRQCILDGLQAKYRRDDILPSDNLQIAFKKGYSDRTALTRIMEAELDGLSGEMTLEGPLALPQGLVKTASSELKGRVFLTKIIAGQKVAEIARIRRPIFRQLVEYSRDSIEKEIPGSKQIALIPQQEAGLVRNLIFGWAAFRKPLALLETEDFMTYRQVYLKEIQQDDALWKELAQLAGLDSPETVAYLKDMSAQVADLLASVPDRPAPGTDSLAVASTINTAFKELEKHFLVVNPFNRFPSFSEDPNDVGRSIWDSDRSTTLVIGGVTYRMPKVSTLNLGAFLISGQNPTRAHHYRTGADHVADLTAEVVRQNSDRAIPTLENKIEHDQRALERLRETITKGRVPAKGATTKAEVSRLAESQSALMQDEIQFIPAVRSYHNRYVKLGLDLIRRYQYGEPVESDSDFRDILTLHYTPGILRELVLYFTRERIATRVGRLEEMLSCQNFAEAMMSATSNYAERKFAESLEVTVVDVLASRNNAWLNQLLKPAPDLSPAQLATTWLNILIQEGRHLESEAEKRTIYSSKGKDIILGDKHDPLGRKYAYVQRLRDELKAGVTPIDKALFQFYLNQWRKEADQRIARAITGWTDRDSIIATLEKRLKENESNEGTEYLRTEVELPYGPARILLGDLSKIGPDELWPDYPVGIADVAHRTRWKDPRDPYELYSGFQDWLTANGVYLEEGIFKKLIKPSVMASLSTSGSAYHRLFGIEDELQTWYGNQRSRLMAQVSGSPRFYSTPPVVMIRTREIGIASKQRSLESLREKNAGRLASRFKQLQQLGLIRAEES